MTGYITEIVLPLGFADVIFRRERSDDRKYVCGSQATDQILNTSTIHSWINPLLLGIIRRICITYTTSRVRGSMGPFLKKGDKLLNDVIMVFFLASSKCFFYDLTVSLKGPYPFRTP